MTRIIIAGCRDFNDYDLLKKIVDEYIANINDLDITIISGMAKGADQLGERYAYENHIAVKVFPARWDWYGRAAGPKRNEEMAEFASHLGCDGHLIAFWDGKSRGTKSMIQLARSKGLTVKVVQYE